MKTPHLLASFAVAATVTAADLKSPDTVAREWHESTAPAPVTLTSDLSLKGQTGPIPHVPTPRPVSREPIRLPESLYDAPLYRAPKKLPDARPRGAVPWEYKGEVYWLVPLTTRSEE